MIKRLYIDTSVFGGYFEPEFEFQTQPFFETIKERGLTILVSSILELEIYRAPENIIELFESIPDNLIEQIELTEEVRQLAEMYVKAKVVGKTSIADCQHIALATINKADVLVS